MQLSFLKTRIGASILVALLLIALGAGTKVYSNHVSAKSEIAQKVGLIADSSVQQGLKNGTINWEDSLRLLKNPDVSTTSIATSSGFGSSTTEITATDKFARELFTLYAQAKQGGKTIDETTANQIAESALSNDYGGQAPQNTISDLKTTMDTSVSKAKSYGNAVGAILSTPRPIQGQELEILQRIINKESSESDFQDLALVLKYYQNLITSLKNTAVPQDATTSHLSLINGLDYMAYAVEGMLSLDSDPIGSLRRVKGYEDGVDLFVAGSIGLKNYFATKGVTFSSGEKGYGLVR